MTFPRFIYRLLQITIVIILLLVTGWLITEWYVPDWQDQYNDGEKTVIRSALRFANSVCLDNPIERWLVHKQAVELTLMAKSVKGNDNVRGLPMGSGQAFTTRVKSLEDVSDRPLYHVQVTAYFLFAIPIISISLPESAENGFQRCAKKF